MPFILAFFLAVWSAAGQPADLILTHGNIYTLDPARPQAASVAVRGGRILAVGDDLSGHAGPRTRMIDLGGATVIPGLIDAHGHMRGLGEQIDRLDLRTAASALAIGRLVGQAARGRKPGEWILGRGWDQTAWRGSHEFPSSAPLDEFAPNHPVFLVRVDGHAGWANRKAIEVAGLNAQTADPPGGKILRDSSGQPTGVLIDRAQGLVSRHIPPRTPQQIKRALERAARQCARLGLTGVHDAGAGETELSAYRELIAEKRLPVRVYLMIGGDGPLWRQWLARGPETGDFLTIRSIKLMADGALGSRGAALLEPYSDEPSHRGLAILAQSDIERIAKQAVAHGFQVNTHAIGDAANRAVLRAYAAALGGPNDKRFRIEHAQVVAPDDFAWFARYSIIASIQATHATSDMRWAEQRLGPVRLQGAYAWQTFRRHGVRISNGSDFPVEDPNPLWGFYASVTRQDHAGQPPGGWQPGQRMTREEALSSFTLDAAYAAFDENRTGSLAPGKFADLVVLSHDIMKVSAAAILETRVKMTVLNGEIVYSE